MPLITEVYDSLPYIDPSPTPAQHAEITALLTQELLAADIDTSLPHPLLPGPPASKFSPAIEQELTRLSNDESSKMVGGVDLSRYEEVDESVLEEIKANFLASKTQTAAVAKTKRPAAKGRGRGKKAVVEEPEETGNSNQSTTNPYTPYLLKSHTNNAHLATRLTNLSLLEIYGKNAWLVGNDSLEGVLRGLERELEERKREIDGVVAGRMERQGGVEGEVKGMEGVWRRGVGRVVEGGVGVVGVEEELGRWRRERARGVVGAAGGAGGGAEGDAMEIDG